MRILLLSMAIVLGATSAAPAQAIALKPALAGIAFLVGTWGSGTGKVAETNGTSRGTSTIAPEIGGAALLRRDHTDLFDAGGKATGGFDQIMLIYSESGTLRADYADGDHVIHYVSAAVVPGRSVVFSTAASPDAPAFRLTYESADSGTLDVTFAMAPPGQTDFHPIATGTLHRRS